MTHLDTNFLISAIQTGSAEAGKVNAWLTTKEPLGISAVAWAEFFCGPLSAQAELMARKMFRDVEPFSGHDAELAADLFNKTGRRSKTLADCMIAAVAIRCGAKLATVNTTDFRPFASHGLSLA
jgi:predicted nucleic acid-binding protein